MISHSTEYEKTLDLNKRKSLGIVYTPKPITDFIVEQVYDYTKNLNATVLDPACGCGNFLISAQEYLVKNGIDHIQASSNLYGVDVDCDAISVAKNNLPTCNIKHGNSLIDHEFDWNEQFPNVMNEGGFDIIIGNPPYVRGGKYPDLKPYLEKNYKTYHGNADLYVYFFERSLNLLKEGGVLFFVVSNKWLLSDYGKKLRAYILSKSKIIDIYKKLDVKTFKGISVDTMMIFLKKQEARSTYDLNVYTCI